MLDALKTHFSIILGKTIQKFCNLYGGGSALPGLIVEKLQPSFVNSVLSKLPYGIVVISGTNGKTTTTKIVSELLHSQNLRVFTNNTGSNFVRGVISAILQSIKLTGRFNYDIAVLELDEAHSRKFTEVSAIDHALLLNVSEDQLDRFGTTQNVAKLLANLSKHAKRGTVVNRDDPLLSKITGKKVSYFGVSSTLKTAFSANKVRKTTKTNPVLTELSQVHDQHITLKVNDTQLKAKLKLRGVFNAINATAALALVKTILPDSDNKSLLEALSQIDSAFGRGETLTCQGQTVELILVKNPASLQANLASFADSKHDYMITINNRHADGQDISWLKKVDFSSLKSVQVCSGECANQVATHLESNQITVKYTNPNLKKALNFFLKSSNRPKRIFANYTTMAELRKFLNK